MERIKLTHRERIVKALTLQIPDYVPTWEFDFQLSMELLGKEFYGSYKFELPFKYYGKKEQDYMAKKNAELYIKEAELLGHSMITIGRAPTVEDRILTLKEIKKLVGNEYFLITAIDNTLRIKRLSADNFVYKLYDEPGQVKLELKKDIDNAIEKAKMCIDAGFDGFILGADYCLNTGPFLSPEMFAEFITPYLLKEISAMRGMGAYVIKHTDGNIMPVIDQLIECKPHALHSIDPQAGVDIKEVKKKYGDKVCLIGNVNCAVLQMGTKEQVAESARYAITHGKPGGGYIFSTSNCVFKGIPLENYFFMLDIWKKARNYE